ncbi:hypothetical protein TEA_026102 [Camellia sinensis var. sinensis]|uniref:GDSL esterase/lipase n=1 Tax=Camellia sinensis var. sinensis TaxID=542762 RepID=A0A4S4ELB2_CAMSN|nr:hypothetical protein TEA_026102 [Camellia sinensis var. sinensis]
MYIEVEGVQGGSSSSSSSQHNTTHRGLYGFHPTKLFVFGDSYADTGNNRKSIADSWKVPYGITFPGKPTGRFSDGRVLTDYLARFLGLKSPIPYRWRKFAANRLRNGMNFAYGGTGVFDTLVLDPNMTTQIDFLEKLVNNDSVYTKWDLQSSLGLVTLSGNDYGAFLAKGGSTQCQCFFFTSSCKSFVIYIFFVVLVRAATPLTEFTPFSVVPVFGDVFQHSMMVVGPLYIWMEMAITVIVSNVEEPFILCLKTDLPSFISAVVDQLAENLKRIQDIGVRKVAVTAMQPLGCLPRSTVLNSFQECNATENTAVTFHNLLLQQAVSKLNNNSKDSSAFVILDLYGSFISVLKTKGNFLGSVKFETPLKPCCMGTSSGHYCGSLDEKGAKMYAFFATSVRRTWVIRVHKGNLGLDSSLIEARSINFAGHSSILNMDFSSRSRLLPLNSSAAHSIKPVSN